MSRPVLYPATFFASLLFYTYWVVHEWFGYPLVPATTTNDYWELVTLNVEVLGLVLLSFIPAMLFAALTTSVIFGLLALGRFMAGYAIGGKSNDA